MATEVGRRPRRVNRGEGGSRVRALAISSDVTPRMPASWAHLYSTSRNSGHRTQHDTRDLIFKQALPDREFFCWHLHELGLPC